MTRALHLPIAIAAVLAGCDHAAPDDAPAPRASVATLGVALGTCDDPSRCQSECDAGSADRCMRLAASYAFGAGVDKDETHATSLYEHACDLHDAPACVFAGQMHEYAHGVPKDDAKAAALYDRACTEGWTAGCYNLAIMFERGRGVPVDLDKALTLYGTACASGAGPACEKAKELRLTASKSDRE